MKKVYFLIVLFVLLVSTSGVKAQEWSTGLDIYSSYIWRGAKFGSGPAFQPYVDYTVGGLSVGAWGSVNASDNEALEMDLYLGYSFDFGLSVTVTDYYFGGDFMTGDVHTIEPMVSFETGGFSITGAYMLDADVYAELGYSFKSVDLFVGAGNGLYTDPTGVENKFGICNVGLGTSKEIAITEKFSLPVSGSVILNPSTGGFFITVGISL